MTARPSITPAVTRVVDVLTIVMLLLAINVYVTGGFRESGISVTSWWRPLVLSMLLLAARHWWQPRPSIAMRAAAWWRALYAAPGVRAVWPITVGSRAAVLAVGFLAVVLFGYRDDIEVPWRLYENEFLNLPARWDTGWYLSVVTEGYRWEPARIEQQQNIAFFPLYPTLIEYGSVLLARNYLWTGVAISWVAFFAALIYLYRFVRERVGEEAALPSIALLASYPFALFFSAAYTEALFLLTIVAACYHFERDELWKAAVWGLLAGLSRPNGALLSVTLAFIAVRPLWLLPHRGRTAGRWREAMTRIGVAAMPGIGMLLFATYIYGLTGDPLQWVAQNAAWGRVYRGVDALFEQQAMTIGEHGLYTYAATQTLDMLQLLVVVLMLASVWGVGRRIGWPYAVLIMVNLGLPLLMGGLLSIGRVTAVLFPAFIWLGLVIPPTHRPAWICAFAMLQAICAALFFTWRPLF